MKASEIIAKLVDIIASHGDIEIIVLENPDDFGIDSGVTYLNTRKKYINGNGESLYELYDNNSPCIMISEE